MCSKCSKTGDANFCEDCGGKIIIKKQKECPKCTVKCDFELNACSTCSYEFFPPEIKKGSVNELSKV